MPLHWPLFGVLLPPWFASVFGPLRFGPFEARARAWTATDDTGCQLEHLLVEQLVATKNVTADCDSSEAGSVAISSTLLWPFLALSGLPGLRLEPGGRTVGIKWRGKAMAFCCLTRRKIGLILTELCSFIR